MNGLNDEFEPWLEPLLKQAHFGGTKVVVSADGLKAMETKLADLKAYLEMFKYTDHAIKAMMENPQDRTAATRKLIEGLGGKLDGFYFYATSGDWDGIVLVELPDSVTAEALYVTVETTGNFQKQAIIPLMTGEQFKAAMEKAQQARTGYTPPTTSK